MKATFKKGKKVTFKFMARNILQEPIRNVLKKLKVGKKVKVKASYGKTTVKKTVKVKK